MKPDDDSNERVEPDRRFPHGTANKHGRQVAVRKPMAPPAGRNPSFLRPCGPEAESRLGVPHRRYPNHRLRPVIKVTLFAPTAFLKFTAFMTTFIYLDWFAAISPPCHVQLFEARLA